MARPAKKFSEKDTEEIRRLAGGLNQLQIAHIMGCSDKTLRAAMKRQPEVLSAYLKGKSEAIALVSGSLIQSAINGDTHAARLFLSTQAGWVARTEITGADGSPIQTQTDHHWTIEYIEKKEKDTIENSNDLRIVDMPLVSHLP